MKIVLDTNVLVSAFLNPYGLPARILDLVTQRKVTLLLDERILFEYREVLRREEFAFDPFQIDQVLAFFDRVGLFTASIPLDFSIPDADDMPFLEVAFSGRADALVTGNKKDYGRVHSEGPKILSPSEFVTYFSNHSA